MAFRRIKGGISELLHIAQSVPDLDNGCFDARSQKAYDNAVGIKHDGLRCRDIEDLASHNEEVGKGFVQLVRENDDIARWLLLSKSCPDQCEISGRGIALSTYAYNAPLRGKNMAEAIEEAEASSGHGDGKGSQRDPPG